jgi:hypothetical protein
MSRFILTLSMLAALLGARVANAQSVLPRGHAPAQCHQDSKPCGCPDDYCRKPWPRIACRPCGEPFCYCGKPWPRIWILCCGECDVYCRKPCPQHCRPLRQDFYTCGQPDYCRGVVAPPQGDKKIIVIESPRSAPAGRR